MNAAQITLILVVGFVIFAIADSLLEHFTAYRLRQRERDKKQ